MSFASLNGVNASKGLQGSNRTSAATFAGAGAPLQGAPQGMTNGSMQAAPALGSSYTRGAGMTGGPLTQGLYGDANSKMSGGPSGAVGLQQSGHLSGGVVPGQGVASAVPYQAPTQMSQAEMQDPNNAAMAGFQFAQSQDRPASAPTGAAPIPQAVQNPGNSVGPSGGGVTNMKEFAANPAVSNTGVAGNPISKALGPQGMPIFNKQVM